MKLKGAFLLDARSPKEYQEDHILKAVNIPTLNDEERHEIGLIYKQTSREEAIKKGMKYFTEKIPRIMDKVKDCKDRQIIVYCARGGMRSKVIVDLLNSAGYQASQLEGGYKSFRNYLLERLKTLEVRPKLIVLYGLTCTGKTKLLNLFSNSIDLEGLAQHRSSLYGAIGLKPNSQKKFENLLLQRIEELQDEKYVMVEGESRRIGDVIIPESFWKTMKKGVAVLVKRKIERRAQETVDEYFSSKENIQAILKITCELRRVISNKKRLEAVAAIKNKDYHLAAKILLEDYYDPLYAHTLKQQDFSFEIDNDDMEKAVEELKAEVQAYFPVVP